MEYKLNINDWERCKVDNINLIKQCNMQILMAVNILSLVEEEINKLNKEEIVKEDNKLDNKVISES